jgi:hypothetical protein
MVFDWQTMSMDTIDFLDLLIVLNIPNTELVMTPIALPPDEIKSSY